MILFNKNHCTVEIVQDLESNLLCAWRNGLKLFLQCHLCLCQVAQVHHHQEVLGVGKRNNNDLWNIITRIQCACGELTVLCLCLCNRWYPRARTMTTFLYSNVTSINTNEYFDLPAELPAENWDRKRWRKKRKRRACTIKLCNISCMGTSKQVAWVPRQYIVECETHFQ